jgi:hypothetical protein
VDSLAIFIVLALVGVIVIFLLSVRTKPPRPSRQAAWAHVLRRIGGTVGRRGQISGSHEGRPLEIFLQAYDEDAMFYCYLLRLKIPIQGFDWTIKCDTTTFLDPTQRWHLKSSEEALVRKLTEAGAVELVKQDAARPEVRYRADKGTLEYSDIVNDDTYVPTPAEFEAQLNLLLRLADLNKELNVW